MIAASETITANVELIQLPIGEEPVRYRVRIPDSGGWVLFTEHHPDEFGAALFDASGLSLFGLCSGIQADHEHDEEITSVGITTLATLT